MSAILSAVLLGSLAAPPARVYTVVVHSAHPVSSLHRHELSALFLRRASQWDDGTPVLPVDGPDSAARERFSKEILGRTPAAVRSYWLQMVFSGRGIPPPEKSSDLEVVAYVKAHPGAIGYVAVGTSTSGVLILEVEP